MIPGVQIPKTPSMEKIQRYIDTWPIHSLEKSIQEAVSAERERCVTLARKVQNESDCYNGAFDGIEDLIGAIERGEK